MVVCVAISPTRGTVHVKYGERSFNGEAMVQFLHELREKIPKPTKVALVWDNCVIHRTRAVHAAAADELDIQLVYGLPYRCDLATVGVERVFRRAKFFYRRWVDREKALCRTWSQRAMVEYIFSDLITDSWSAKQALKCGPAVMNARPIMPLPYVEAPGARQ